MEVSYTRSSSSSVLNVYLIPSFWEATQGRPFIFQMSTKLFAGARARRRARAGALVSATCTCLYVCVHRNVRVYPDPFNRGRIARDRRIPFAILQLCKSRGGFLNTSVPSSEPTPRLGPSVLGQFPAPGDFRATAL